MPKTTDQKMTEMVLAMDARIKELEAAALREKAMKAMPATAAPEPVAEKLEHIRKYCWNMVGKIPEEPDVVAVEILNYIEHGEPISNAGGGDE